MCPRVVIPNFQIGKHITSTVIQISLQKCVIILTVSLIGQTILKTSRNITSSNIDNILNRLPVLKSIELYFVVHCTRHMGMGITEVESWPMQSCNYLLDSLDINLRALHSTAFGVVAFKFPSLYIEWSRLIICKNET
jgi:hypothetical protein